VTPSADVATLVIECADAEPMVRMYQALGAVPDIRYPGTGVLVLSGLTISFQERADYQAPTWPTPEVPSQLHLDFFVDSPEEMQDHLHGVGARTPDHQPHRDSGLLVMLDPAGHPFCIGTRVGP